MDLFPRPMDLQEPLHRLMRTLYHLPLDPGSRKIRILLAEKRLEVELEVEKVWERRQSFLRINPAGEVPVLIEADGTSISGAGVTAAAHLSAVDYLGDVPWGQHREAKAWYARVKSRPSLASLLADHIPGVPPPKHHADLDF